MQRMSSNPVRTTLAAIVAVVSLAVAGIVVLAAPPAGAATCHVTWGSSAKTDARMSQARIVGARAGQHTCYDRLVIELSTPTPPTGFTVRYVSQVTVDGSGAVLPLRGGARIEVVVRAPAHNAAGTPTYHPANPKEAVSVAGFRTFRQVAFGSTFEGITTFGLGVRARLPFRVFRLAGPGGHTRLVIDVAHSWA